jgi:hypothetical protein
MRLAENKGRYGGSSGHKKTPMDDGSASTAMQLPPGQRSMLLRSVCSMGANPMNSIAVAMLAFAVRAPAVTLTFVIFTLI